MTIDLDFEKGTLRNRDRLNYRFDAVAAVQVVQAGDGVEIFQLTLLNSYSIEAEVSGATAESVEPGESSRVVAEATLDAAGLRNTLHVLEGIAAEGRKWVDLEREREGGRLGTLTDALHSIVD